LLNIKII